MKYHSVRATAVLPANRCNVSARFGDMTENLPGGNTGEPLARRPQS
ncbi:hypothetical protein ACIBVL_22905 [Streptomyces sp. NPDC049687]